MFHKVQSVKPLKDYILLVEFSNELYANGQEIK